MLGRDLPTTAAEDSLNDYTYLRLTSKIERDLNKTRVQALLPTSTKSHYSPSISLSLSSPRMTDRSSAYISEHESGVFGK